MLDMATPKKPGRRKPKRKGKPLNVWIDDRLRDALDAAVEATRPKSHLKAVVEAALEDYLKSRGLWPPQTPDRAP